VAAGDDSRAGYPGPYIGLYCRNEGVFRPVKVQRRADADLRRYLSPEAAERESTFPAGRFTALDLARSAVRKEDQRDELRYARMDVQVRATTERQPVYRERDKASGWGTVAKAPNGDLVGLLPVPGLPDEPEGHHRGRVPDRGHHVQPLDHPVE